MPIKKLMRSMGYDIRRHHSLYDSVLKHYDIQSVIDIGANDGHWSREIRTLLGNVQIYAFEPIKDCFARLTKEFQNDLYFKAFNVALGDIDGVATIERSSFHPSSSLRSMTELHKNLYPKSAQIIEESIEIKRLDSLAADLDFTPEILIKMDVQGFEDKVIAGGEMIIKQARVIIVETSFVTLYKNQPLFDDIHKQLHALGFSYRGNCGEHFSRLTGERIYEDSIFVRQ